MGSIIRLHYTPHDDIRALLPWYVTERLDPVEHARVASHLKSCRECQEDLEFERRLGVEVAIAPVDVEQGWASMQRRLEAASSPSARVAGLQAWRGALSRQWVRSWRASPPWLGWALAAQAALIMVAGALTMQMTAQKMGMARYHALGSAPAARAGNVLVIFRPDTRESVMRQALTSADARLIDGPTAADAYVLHVPPAEREAALARLRARGEVVLAEPIDGAGPS